MADSEKRKGRDDNKEDDEEEADVVKKKARSDVVAVLDVVLAKERTLIPAWTRIVEGLYEAGIRKCDECLSGKLKWTRGPTRYVELQVRADHEVSKNNPIARYEIHSNTGVRSFYDPHWKDALQYLKDWIEAMRVDADRVSITSTLRNELDAWDKFLELFPSDKIPAYSEFSFIDGHLVFEWHGKDGRIVTLDRVPCPAYDDDDGKPGVYKDGRLISFRVSKSPDLGDKADRVFAGNTKEVIAKIAEFLH